MPNPDGTRTARELAARREADAEILLWDADGNPIIDDDGVVDPDKYGRPPEPERQETSE